MSQFFNPFGEHSINIYTDSKLQENGTKCKVTVIPKNINPFDYQPEIEMKVKDDFKPLYTEPPLRNQPLPSSNNPPILSTSQETRKNNWPYLPDNCVIKSCFYQNIDVDIPLEFQPIVNKIYKLWKCHGFVWILNILGGLLIEEPTIVLLGSIYALFFIPLSYIVWFRPLYKAFQTDSSFNFLIFFFGLSAQSFLSITNGLGFPSEGTVGLYVTIHYFTKASGWYILIGFFCLSVALSYLFLGAMDIIVIQKIHKIYRSSGASIVKAQQEITNEIIYNQNFRKAANDAFINAVKIQLK